MPTLGKNWKQLEENVSLWGTPGGVGKPILGGVMALVVEEDLSEKDSWASAKLYGTNERV